MKLLSYIPREVGYKTIHSFIRREFATGTPGFSRGDLFVVGCNHEDFPKKGLIMEQSVDPDLFRDQESVHLSVLISFSNRGKKLAEPPFYNRSENLVNPDRWKRVIVRDEKHAIDKFCSLAGLAVPDRTTYAHLIQPTADRLSEFRGMINTKNPGAGQKNLRVNIENCFEISGEFLISDPDKFVYALEHGCGSRKSYGFGLIFIRETSEEEDLLW